MEKIFEILKDNDWDKLEVIVKDNGTDIKMDFKHEDNFVQYVQDRIKKFDATFDGYEPVFDSANKTTTLVFRYTFGADRKLSNSYIKSLGADIMIDLTDDEIQDIKNTEGSIRQKFMKVVSINTDDVEPLFYPFEEPHTFLREDDDMHVTDHEAVLANAPTTQGDFITVAKVVK